MSEWISAGKYQPKRERRCDVYIKTPDGEEGRVCNVWYVEDGDKWFMHGMAQYIDGRYVTHWMPSPEPPTK